MLSVIQPPPKPSLPARDSGEKKFNSRLVAPTFFRNEPFGENVEGLSHCGDESCAVEPAVQKHDFKHSTLCIVIGGKPLLANRFRKFKNARRQIRCFMQGPLTDRSLRTQTENLVNLSTRKGAYMDLCTFQTIGLKDLDMFRRLPWGNESDSLRHLEMGHPLGPTKEFLREKNTLQVRVGVICKSSVLNS